MVVKLSCYCFLLRTYFHLKKKQNKKNMAVVRSVLKSTIYINEGIYNNNSGRGNTD